MAALADKRDELVRSSFPEGVAAVLVDDAAVELGRHVCSSLDRVPLPERWDYAFMDGNRHTETDSDYGVPSGGGRTGRRHGSICIEVESGRRSRLRWNADQLESALLRSRAAVGASDGDLRARRHEAIAFAARYVDLLREMASETQVANDGGFSLKLEFEDGTWTVDELPVSKRPDTGDVVYAADRRWCVSSSLFVFPPSPGREAREIFVCRPAA